MRKIKFRAWDANLKKFLPYPVYADHLSFEGFVCNDRYFDTTEEKIIFQQYTNQTRDGVDIYEGDIVEAYWPDIFVGDEVKGSVVWNDHFNELLYPGWVIDTGKGLAAFPPWVKVLGNIFEGVKK